MIGSKVKVGVHYAVSTEPRKGVKDERLSYLNAFRVQVLEKNVERWANNASDGYGRWTNDGIKALRLNDDGTESEHFTDFVIKARDILMPWEQYQGERDERARKERERAETQAELERQWEIKRVAMRNRLKDEFGLVDGYANNSPDRDFVEYNQHADHSIMYGFTQKGLEKLLGTISEKVYEIVSAME